MIPRLNETKNNQINKDQILPIEFQDKKNLEVISERELLSIVKKDTGKTSIGTITGDLLLKAPKDFFYQFDALTKEITQIIQRQLADDPKKSESIANAQREPTNMDLQNIARSEAIAELIVYNDSPHRSTKLITMDETKQKILNGLVLNEILGFGPLEPLWRDTQITEIIANGPYDIQVEIAGNIHKVPACHFRDQEHLMNLIDRLYRSINKTLSFNDPMLKGRLYDKSRMMAVHPIVAPDGPNFNIRRHSNDFVTPEQLINLNTSNIELMTFIGNLINSGISSAIIGGTGSGKTTLLDALTSYIPNDKRCISLEDNLEMKPHPNKLFAAAMETIAPKPGSLKEQGVTMRDLVKASLQMRPETIIVGEVTDGAAYDLCQALNTGHDGMSTIHANDSEAAMYRLMSLISQSDLIKEHAAYDLISSAFDVIICVKRFALDGTRKIVSIHEVGNKVETDDEGNKFLPLTPLWEFKTDPKRTYEEGRVVGDWVEVNEISEELREKHNLNITKQLSWPELQELAKITTKKEV